jgi:hypothetical protein
MTVAEIMPKLQELPRADRLQVVRLLVDRLAREEVSELPESAFIMPPEDKCPFTPAELKRAYYDTEPGVPLSEIWRSLGCQ